LVLDIQTEANISHGKLGKRSNETSCEITAQSHRPIVSTNWAYCCYSLINSDIYVVRLRVMENDVGVREHLISGWKDEPTGKKQLLYVYNNCVQNCCVCAWTFLFW